MLFCIALCCNTHALCPCFPSFFAVPPWQQYNKSNPPPHQIKQTLCMYGSTQTGINRRQSIIQFSNIFVQNDSNFQFPLKKLISPQDSMSHCAVLYPSVTYYQWCAKTNSFRGAVFRILPSIRNLYDSKLIIMMPNIVHCDKFSCSVMHIWGVSHPHQHIHVHNTILCCTLLYFSVLFLLCYSLRALYYKALLTIINLFSSTALCDALLLTFSPTFCVLFCCFCYSSCLFFYLFHLIYLSSKCIQMYLQNK